MTWAAIAAKELREEARSRETLLPVLLIALLVVAIGLLAFHDVAERSAVTAGVLWIALAFAAAVGMGRAFGAERDRGTLDTLLTLPVERGHVFLGKAASAFLLLLLVGVVTVPVYLAASGAPAPAGWPGLVALLALGALGLAAAGTMASSLAANTRARDLMLPVLLFPLLVPLLLSGIHGTMDVLDGAPFAEWRPELLVLSGYDLAFLAVSWLLFEQAVGA